MLAGTKKIRASFFRRKEDIEIKHVQEAYRLLSKAIIHVYQPDIDLNEYNRPTASTATDENMEVEEETTGTNKET